MKWSTLVPNTSSSVSHADTRELEGKESVSVPLHTCWLGICILLQFPDHSCRQWGWNGLRRTEFSSEKPWGEQSLGGMTLILWDRLLRPNCLTSLPKPFLIGEIVNSWIIQYSYSWNSITCFMGSCEEPDVSHVVSTIAVLSIWGSGVLEPFKDLNPQALMSLIFKMA